MDADGVLSVVARLIRIPVASGATRIILAPNGACLMDTNAGCIGRRPTTKARVLGALDETTVGVIHVPSASLIVYKYTLLFAVAAYT